MKKVLYTHNTVDTTTGELIQKEWFTKQVLSPEHFVKMYIQDLTSLNFLTHAEYRILIQLATILEYNTNNFTLSKERRVALAKLATITVNTFNQSFARLVKKKLILKVESTIYQMNPKFFFNGEEMKRAKMLEVVLQYQICPDCK